MIAIHYLILEKDINEFIFSVNEIQTLIRYVKIRD